MFSLTKLESRKFSKEEIAILGFDNEESTKKAIQEMTGHKIEDKQITIEIKKDQIPEKPEKKSKKIEKTRDKKFKQKQSRVSDSSSDDYNYKRKGRNDNFKKQTGKPKRFTENRNKKHNNQRK